MLEPYGVCKDICKHGCLHTHIVQVYNTLMSFKSDSDFMFILKKRRLL